MKEQQRPDERPKICKNTTEQLLSPTTFISLSQQLQKQDRDGKWTLKKTRPVVPSSSIVNKERGHEMRRRLRSSWNRPHVHCNIFFSEPISHWSIHLVTHNASVPALDCCDPLLYDLVRRNLPVVNVRAATAGLFTGWYLQTRDEEEALLWLTDNLRLSDRTDDKDRWEDQDGVPAWTQKHENDLMYVQIWYGVKVSRDVGGRAPVPSVTPLQRDSRRGALFPFSYLLAASSSVPFSDTLK